ncbi:dopamine receptor 3-like isoform X2 [Dreissena polymorpha]|nr:dopamine receptor 3-like isoform X2 [Dreissena polymorpha]
MDVLMCTASIWHMCTMSMDRYFTLKYPMQYGRNKTRSMVAVKIIFVWIISITISSPVFIYSLVDYSYVFKDRNCVIDIKEFVIYGSIFAFYVPLLIMIVTYSLTIQILRQNQNIMKTIERSNFRMKSKSSNRESRICSHVRTFLSPPSSESRRESHTDISSLARSPNIEKTPDMSDSDMKLLELKNVIDYSYATNLYTSLKNDRDLKSSSYRIANETSMANQTTVLTSDDNSDTKSYNENLHREYLQQNPSLNVPTAVNIQSPSSDDDDESSTLLPTNLDKLSRSLSHSTSSSKFRLRANTDVHNKSYLSIHSSLKIPKSFEKNNLQSSVSCSNFTNASAEKNLFASLRLNGSSLNRDYKSVEWCHHFYEIQEEMDQFLKESKQERKQLNLESLKSSLISSCFKDMSNKNSTETQDSGIASCSKKDQSCLDNTDTGEVSESGDFPDDTDTSSENISEIMLKLQPNSVFMYKLDILQEDQTKSSDIPSNNDNTQNCIQRRPRDCSLDSDVSNELAQRVVRKPSSIKRFIYKCKKKNGLKHLVSSKSTSNEKKASKVLGIIFGVFVVLWTPFFIANILSATCGSCMVYLTPELMSAFLWMGYVASLANPIIYTMFNTAFRRAFIKILSCHLCTLGRNSFSQGSFPASHHATVFTDRRQTLTVMYNGTQPNDSMSGGR